MAGPNRQRVLLQRRMNLQNHLFRGFGLGIEHPCGCYHARLKNTFTRALARWQ